eukprot:14985490-Alexandrium_andersonii.AAC.1
MLPTWRGEGGINSNRRITCAGRSTPWATCLARLTASARRLTYEDAVEDVTILGNSYPGPLPMAEAP